MRGEERVGVGADRVEGDVAEVEQAGEADDDVQAPAEHHVDQDLDAEIVDPLDRALDAGERQDDEGVGEEDQHQRDGTKKRCSPAKREGVGGDLDQVRTGARARR